MNVTQRRGLSPCNVHVAAILGSDSQSVNGDGSRAQEPSRKLHQAARSVLMSGDSSSSIALNEGRA